MHVQPWVRRLLNDDKRPSVWSYGAFTTLGMGEKKLESCLIESELRYRVHMSQFGRRLAEIEIDVVNLTWLSNVDRPYVQDGLSSNFS